MAALEGVAAMVVVVVVVMVAVVVIVVEVIIAAMHPREVMIFWEEESMETRITTMTMRKGLDLM